MSIGVISHDYCALHNMGENHPEAPARMAAVQDQLKKSGLTDVVRQYNAKPIDRKLLALAHDLNYIDFIYTNSPTQGNYIIDADTSMNADTLTAALYSAGAAVDAVDLVMKEKISSAFCATRPPGHHAERNKAMGFCFFNNVAIAAAYSKEKYQLERVAIVDFDVHHGNGTQDIVSDKKGYLFCSTFQHPLYPYSGAGDNSSNIINSPLAANAKSDDFRQAIINDWLPALHEFKPQLIFISAGFDAHKEDDISNMCLTEADYFWVTQQLKIIADTYAQGRIVSVLEGGYALSALGRSVVAHIKGLIG